MTATAHDTSPNRSLQCMEVWGGNDRVDTGVGTFGLDVWLFSQPFGRDASNGGDVYYVSSCASGNITRLMLADVSGHGPEVADVAGQLRTLMRANVNRISQKRLVRDLNNQFVQLTEVGCFATALVFSYFAPSRKLQISNAGHPPPFVFRTSDGQWSMLAEHQPARPDRLSDAPLGVQQATDYSSLAAKLEPGDMVLCFSDALPELQLANGKQLGSQRLGEIINGLDVSEPQAIVPQLLELLDRVTTGRIADAEDDLTILLFRAQVTRPMTAASRALTSVLSFFKRQPRDARPPVPAE